MALDPCVEMILCSLAPPVIGMVRGFIEPYRAQLQVQIAAIRAHLAVFAIITAPFDAAQVIAEAALDAVRSAAMVIPLGAIAGCADLGDLNIGFERVVAPTVAEAQAKLDEIKRILNVVEELQAIVDELQALDAFFDEVLGVIAGCGVA